MDLAEIKDDIIWIYYDEVTCSCADAIIEHLDEYFEDAKGKSFEKIGEDMLSIYDEMACQACAASLIENLEGYFKIQDR